MELYLPRQRRDRLRNFGEVMRRFALMRRTMKQGEMAKAARVSEQMISDVANGRRMPSGKLLRWLGFELAYLPLAKAAKNTKRTTRGGQPTPRRARVADPPQSTAVEPKAGSAPGIAVAPEPGTQSESASTG